jgi:hypothetical protein
VLIGVGNLRKIVRACPWRCILDIIIARHVFRNNRDAKPLILRQKQRNSQTNNSGTIKQFVIVSYIPLEIFKVQLNDTSVAGNESSNRLNPRAVIADIRKGMQHAAKQPEI